MLTVRHKSNPFGKADVKQVPFEGKSLQDCLAPYLAGKEFAYPTFVRVNGTPWLRERWSEQVPDKSEIEIIAVVGEVITILTVVTLVASIAFSAYGIYQARKAMRALRAGAGQAEPDPFFSVDGHANKANLNNPVEVAYGKNRMWPSYIGRPYRTYSDDRLPGFTEVNYFKNTNFVQIFCIGQGDFDVHAVQVGEVPAESYRGMRYSVIRPGQTSTDISRIVYIQPDFEETALLANQSTDVFTMSPPGFNCNNFEIDVEINANSEYSFDVIQTLLDENGALTSTSYTYTLSRPNKFSSPESNSPPHRHTFSINEGSSGRYVFQIKNNTTSNTIKILELRSYLDPAIPLGYEDKTLLVVNYFVTSLSEDLVKDKINVIATRRLNTRQIFDGSVTIINQPTRSIPWAIYDVLTNNVYGGGLSEDFIDLETFSELHIDLEKDGVYFDYVFNQSTTVADAVKVIAAAGRCSLGYNGSRLTLIRDIGNAVPEAMFSSENIIPGSFSWSTELFDPTEPDAIEGSYVDIASGEERTTLFVPEGSLSNNVQKTSLQGVGSLKQAWREVCHKLQKLRLVRDSFKFKTGMEGYIPTIGSTAYLSVDMDGMGTSGFVEDYISGQVYLSRPIVPASSGALGKIAFRRDDGSVMGPFLVTGVSSESTIELGSYFVAQIEPINFGFQMFRLDKEPVHFIFSQGDFSTPVATKIQIESVTPSDDGTIEISAKNFDPKVYAFDSMEPPEDEYEPIIPTGSPPMVPWVKIKEISSPVNTTTPYIVISWGSSFGVTSYRVYINEAGSIPAWEGVDTYVELPLQVAFNTLILVAAVRDSIESPLYAVATSIGVSNPVPDISSANYRFEEDGLKLWWSPCASAVGYEVRVAYQLSGVLSAYTGWYACKGVEFKYTKTMFRRDFGNIVVPSFISIFMQVRIVTEAGPSSGFTTWITAISQEASPVSVTVDQDPQVVVGSTFRRHRTIKWQPGAGELYPGTVYHVYMEAYKYLGTPGVLSIKPWVKMTTTDKHVFSTDTTPSEVKDFNLTIYPGSEYENPIYGKGCYATLGFSRNFILDVGDKADHCLYIYDPAYPENGNWHVMIKSGSSQIDGIVWIAKATVAYLTGKKAAVVIPGCSTDASSGSDWRVMGAIVADNGWFDPQPPNSTATFDIDS